MKIRIEIFMTFMLAMKNKKIHFKEPCQTNRHAYST